MISRHLWYRDFNKYRDLDDTSTSIVSFGIVIYRYRGIVSIAQLYRVPISGLFFRVSRSAILTLF